MLSLMLLAAAQVQTVRLPPAPSTQVDTLRVKPDLVVREIRIQNDSTLHVLVANIGTGAVAEYFPVRASVEIAGRSEDLPPAYAEPLAAGAEKWVTFRADWSIRLTRAASATAGADLYPEPKQSSGSWLPWPRMTIPSSFPGMKPPCENLNGCIVELDESNNSYAIAGVPRGTPERLDSPGPAPETLPANPPERG